MKLILKLTPEQQNAIDEFFEKPGRCECGAALGGMRSMLGQPYTSRALAMNNKGEVSSDKIGTISVGAFCPDCYHLFAGLLTLMKSSGRAVLEMMKKEKPL